MKAIVVLILAALFVFHSARGQTNTNAFIPPNDNPPYHPPPAAPRPHIANVAQPEQPNAPSVNTPAPPPDNPDPAKVAEYQKRFQEGYALQQAGKLAEARAIYDGILAEEPQAKRSLLEAGKISMQLGDFDRANEYLSKLHALVPDFPDAIELLIQTNQALKHDVKVELLVRDFIQLRKSGKVPAMAKSLCFIRERIPNGTGQVVVSQFFDPTQSPNTVWMGEVYDSAGQMQKRILLNYDDNATNALRAKDPKYATAQIFTWFGHQITAGQVSQIDAYLQIFALPDYQKFRSAMLIILANPPKPIYSQAVGGH